MSETIQFYKTIFNPEVTKDEEYFISFYSVNIHANGLKSVVLSNLDKNVQSIDSPEAMAKIAVLKQLVDFGVKIYGQAIEYPQMKKKEDVEEDITNITAASPNKGIDFTLLDENDRLQFIINIILSIRYLLILVHESGFDPSSLGDFRQFLVMNHWLSTKLIANFDMDEVNQMLLAIVKEIIYFIFDHVMWNKTIDVDFSDILDDVLIKTHPKLVSGELQIPTIKLSVETLMKIFMIIGITSQTFPIPDFDQFCLQLEPILLYNLKLSYQYSLDLLYYRVMNDSFFHWMTVNLLNFEDSYVNDRFLTNIDINQPKYLIHEELVRTLDTRFKICKNQEKPMYEVREFLPISLYINTVVQENMDKFLQHDISRHWLCLLSYCYQYQFISKNLVIITRLSLIILNKIINYESVEKLTIDEFKWKLCHQKESIIPLNTSDNRTKPLLSYLLDLLAILIRFNMNKKLNVGNFTNVIRLIHIIISKQVDDAYNYDHLFKHIMSFLMFNERFLHKPELTQEILGLYNNVLSLKIKKSLIYEILLHFEKFSKLSIDGYPNLDNLILFLRLKFELGDDANKVGDATNSQKISLTDLDSDSIEFNVLEEFTSERLVEIPKCNINFDEVLKNL